MADNALGKILEIDQKTISDITGLGNSIVAIGEKAEDAAKRFNNAFASMGNSVTGLRDGLATLQSLLGAIDASKLQAGVNGLSAMGAASVAAASSITQAASALGQFSGSSQVGAENARNFAAAMESVKQGSAMEVAARRVKELENQYKDLTQYVSLLNKDKSLEIKAAGFYEYGSEQYRQAKERIQALEKEIRRVNEEIKKVQEGFKNPANFQQNTRSFQDYIDKLNGVSLAAMQYKQTMSDMAAFYKQQDLDNKAAIKAAQDEQKAYSALETQLIRVRQLKQDAQLKGYNSINATAEQSQYYKDILATEEKIAAKMETMRSSNAKLTEDTEKLLKAKSRQLEVSQRIQQQQQQEILQTKKGALEYAASAKTYEQRAQAIKYIESAMMKLNSASATYKQDLNELTAKHKQLKDAQQGVEKAMGRIRNEASGLAATAKQLGSTLAAAFSVQAISGYIKKLLDVRGEFELQNIALGSILQNKERADQLFDKVTQLAVKSPYTVRQLTAYTKQLSAYQVEYKKLYSTTKQLADVAAGLGVDMQRLILAFGQVKAANYLRATEVRQFTEAGINLLGELASYYTELEGQMVTVADVQERVTKRMVEFGDVEQVFERLTNAGGIFYNMQEKQSESLKGMMSNLQDRLDIMLNNIGKENEAAIKGVINTVGNLLDNYKQVINVFKVLLTVFVLYKTNLLVVTEAQKYLRWQLKAYVADALAAEKKTTKFAAALSVLGRQFKTVAAAIKGFVASNGLVLVLLLVTQLATAFSNWRKEIKQQQEEINKLYATHLANLRDIKKKYDEIRKATSNAAEEEDEFAKNKAFTQKLQQLEKLFSAMEDAHIKPTIELDNVDESTIDSVFDTNAALYKKSQEFGYHLGTAFTQALSATVGQNGMPALRKAVENMGDTFDNITAKLEPVLSAYENKAKALFDSLSGDAQKLVEELEKGQEEGEGEIDYLQRRAKLLLEIIKDEQFSNKERKAANKELLKVLERIRVAEVQVTYGMYQITGALNTAYKGYDNLLREAEENPIAFKAAINSELARRQYDELTQEFMREKLYLYYRLAPDPAETNEDSRTLGDIGDKIKALQESLGQKGLFPDIELKKLKTWNDFIEAIRKKYKEIKTEKENLEGVEANAGKTDAETEYNNAIAAYNALLAIAQQFGIILDTSKKADKDATKVAKERIELIKKMRQEYEQNLKYMSADNAKQSTQLAFKDNEVYKQLEQMGVIDVTMNLDAEGVISALERLAATATGAARKEIEMTISQLRNEDVIVDIKANLDTTKVDVDKLFDQYELSKKLKDLGLDESLAMQLFGMDSLNLDELEKSVEKVKELYAKNNKGIGQEAETYFQSVEDKIREQREKNLETMLKTYSKYLKKEFSSAVQIKMEEAKELAQIDELVASGKFTSAQGETAKRGVKAEAQKSLDENSWKEFQQSELYLELFENLENVSTAVLEQMKAKLDAVGQSLKNLSPESLKKVREQITAIESQLADRSSFATLRETIKEIKNLKKENKSEQSLERDLALENETLERLQQQRDATDMILQSRETGVELSAEELRDNALLAEYNKMNADKLHEQSAELSEHIASTKSNISSTTSLLNVYKKGRTAVEAMQNKWNTILSIVGQLKSSVDTVWDALGRTEDDESVETFVNMGLELVELIASAMLFKAAIDTCTVSTTLLGIELKTAIPIIGWILLAVEAIAAVLSAIIGNDNKKFKAQIEDQQEKVDNLVEKYEDLEEAIENCYNISTLKSWNSEAKKALQLAIEEEKAMIAAYKNRKNGSEKYKSEIEELEKAIKDQEQSLKELAENYTEALGGFGSASNLKSAAEDFVSAWVDAFEETGDGLSGLEEQLEEFMSNALKKQALLRVSERFIEPLLQQIDDFANTSKELNDTQYIQGMTALMEKLKTQLPELSAALEPFFAAFKGVESDSLSGLAQGIQGITEDTAEVLASIVESIRYFVSSSNAAILSMSMILATPTEENPWYFQLKRQADATVDIRDTLRKLCATAGMRTVLQVQVV